MKQSIYIKCEHCLLSKQLMFAMIMAAAPLAGISYLLNHYLIISEFNSYLLYFASLMMAIFSLYQLQKVKEAEYIYLTEKEIWFKEKNQNQTICLKFEGLDYFETRFSEIVFCTKEEERMVMALNSIGDEKKRWEIKEFLKGHLTQMRDSRLVY